MRKTALFAALVLICAAVVPAPAAASSSPVPWVLKTDGTPVFCGNAAHLLLVEAQDGTAGAVLLDAASGEVLPADHLAATGALIRLDDDAFLRPFVLAGDLNGSGIFSIAQLVLAAQILTGREPDALQKAAADLNGSGNVDISDLVVLAGYVRSSREPLPAEPYPQPAEPSRTLVVYFSATGCTKRVAELVAAATGGDLLELTPAVPYTAADLDYNDPDSRVYREHQDPALRNIALVQDTVPAWATYDTVFLGYPIWWGGAAWPVNGFLAANDFTGKNVWCFCTSASSGAGSSAAQLEELAGSGTWHGARRFPSVPDPADVDAWIESVDAA